MTNTFFVQAKVCARMESGLMGPYLALIAERLDKEGYSRDCICLHLRAADGFGRWLSEQAIPVAAIDSAILHRYMEGLGRWVSPSAPQGRSPHRSLGLDRLLRILREEGIVGPQISPSTPLQEFLACFDRHLDSVVGAAPRTRGNYIRYARRFFEFRFDKSQPDWSLLCPEDIAQFVQEQSRRMQPSGCRQPVTAMRALLSFLQAQALTPAGLEGAVPPIREWRHTSLPRYLSPEERETIIAGCKDLKESAVVLILARLGLRAGEVIRLTLDDVDWEQGSLLIRAGKSRRERRLPLSQEVGDALALYLQQERRTVPHRYVFLSCRPPFGPLQSSVSITKIVQKAMMRVAVSIRRPGAHVLRHTLATQMVRRGATFKEVADVLGHESLASTALYAKLDLDSLAKVALPWPGGAR